MVSFPMRIRHLYRDSTGPRFPHQGLDSSPLADTPDFATMIERLSAFGYRLSARVVQKARHRLADG
jgi:hypothetical protein